MASELALLRTLLDPAALFERVARDDRTGELVGPFPWQADALRSASKRQIFLTSRQAGKSSTAAVKALHKGTRRAATSASPTARVATTTWRYASPLPSGGRCSPSTAGSRPYAPCLMAGIWHCATASCVSPTRRWWPARESLGDTARLLGAHRGSRRGPAGACGALSNRRIRTERRTQESQTRLVRITQRRGWF
jgi:hypothetical protein